VASSPSHPHRREFTLPLTDLPVSVVCSDKAGRSFPAPGRGALSIAREVHSKHPSPLLDIGYRARQVSFRRKQIGDWLSFEQEQLKEEIERRKTKGQTVDPDFFCQPRR
jgi:fatty acid synthase subunit alpha, fungi type